MNEVNPMSQNYHLKIFLTHLWTFMMQWLHVRCGAHYNDSIDSFAGSRNCLQMRRRRFGGCVSKSTTLSQASIDCPLCITLGAVTPVALRRRTAASGESNVERSKNFLGCWRALHVVFPYSGDPHLAGGEIELTKSRVSANTRHWNSKERKIGSRLDTPFYH